MTELDDSVSDDTKKINNFGVYFGIKIDYNIIMNDGIYLLFIN